MTVLVRIALETGVAPPAGTLLTIVAGLRSSRAVSRWPAASGTSRTRGPSSSRACWRPVSRRSCSRSPSAMRVRRGRPSRSGRLHSSPSRRRSSSSTSRSSQVSCSGRRSSSRAASLLASDRTRPEHFKRVGLVYALVGTIAFAIAGHARALARDGCDRRRAGPGGVRDDADRDDRLARVRPRARRALA